MADQRDNSEYTDDWKYLKLLPTPTDPLRMAELWECEIHGDRDGEGKRFWISGLYLLGGDAKQAYRYFQRYEKANVEESLTSSPEYLLSALLSCIKRNHNIDFDSKGGYLIRRLYGANPYVIPILIGEAATIKQHWHRSNVYGKQYAQCLPEWLYGIWTEDERQLLRDCYHSIEVQSFISVDDQLWKSATDLPIGKLRSAALERHRKYRNVMMGVR